MMEIFATGTGEINNAILGTYLHIISMSNVDIKLT